MSSSYRVKSSPTRPSSVARQRSVEQAASVAATSAQAAATRLRTLARRFGANVPGRLLRLPASSADYTVRHLRIPMRDGVELAADHYAPTNATGTLLVRAPGVIPGDPDGAAQHRAGR